MPEHKMITIDGIRVRVEDEARYRARVSPPAGTGAQAAPLTSAQADPRVQDPDGFNPADHTVLQVVAHLAEADEEETTRVLDAEADGERRKGLLERREEFMQEARTRAGGTGGRA
ncbi:hypothetical protein [Streptomyces sp. NPDC058045]|uniref:hypothetical protein n=1 Tax=Streptomyces sp. NPDC058045 TaxID=3346311 RepID=UPI0036E2474C